MEGIALLAGLGNPGERYAATRHNAGIQFLRRVSGAAGATPRRESRFHAEVARCQLAGRSVWLLAPTTFMNLSGDAVAAFAHYYKIPPQAILIAHDELDLPAGVVRLKCGGGNGGHKGLVDIARKLGSTDFVRLRIGIGHPGSSDDVVDYVLHRPSAEDQALIDGAIDAGRRHLDAIVRGEYQSVMNELHRPPPAAETETADGDASRGRERGRGDC